MARSPLSHQEFTTKNFLKSARAFMIFGLLFSSIATLSNFALLFLSGWFLAASAAAGLGGIATQNLFNMFLPAAGVRFFATVRILTRYCERLITHDAALRITAFIRIKSFEAIIPRALKLKSEERSGDILARFVNDTDMMGLYPLNVVLPRQNAVICGIAIIAIFAAFNQKSAFILAFSLAVGGGIFPLLLQLISHYSLKKTAQNTENLKADILESLQAMADIVFCGGGAHYLQRTKITQKKLVKHQLLSLFYAHFMRQLTAILGLFTLIDVIFMSDFAFQEHLLTGPEIPMLALGVLASFELINPLLEAQLFAAKTKHAEKRIRRLCTSPLTQHLLEEVPTENPLEGDVQYDLHCHNIKLSFHGKEIFKDLHLEIKQGQHLAVIGPSGIGKTSFAHLLMGLLRPDHSEIRGEIRLGGVSLENIPPEMRAIKMALLPQNPYLFQGSLKRNLLIAAPHATEEDMWRALETVLLKEEIQAMPEKLETICGENGVRLSGGQVRRFAAAQILLRRPKFLILDEPTESLPTETGKMMLKNLLSHLPHTSILCITHRAEPLEFMDHIYELKDGSFTTKIQQMEKD